jgi:hypothetical protein
MRDGDAWLIRDLTNVAAKVPPGLLYALGFSIPLKSKHPYIRLGWGEFDALLHARFPELREVVFDTTHTPDFDQAYREGLKTQMPMLNRAGILKFQR